MLKFDDFILAMNNNILIKLDESIRADEAHYDKSAIQTVIDGKRDLGFITIKASVDTSRDEFWDLVKTHNLGTIKLPKNPFDAYIYYRKGAERKAKELEKIANKYGGYLSYEATEAESRRIGELLGYDKRDIDQYINKNYR
jgi:hypothetical protein